MRKRLKTPGFAQVLNALLIILMCGISPNETREIIVPILQLSEVALHIPEFVKDREGWATDVIQAIRATNREPTAERVCAVLAVIEQESNFQADPVVPELPRIVRQGLEKKLARLGVLAAPALDVMLLAQAPGSDLSFGQRIAKLRTERDLDRFFRDMADSFRQKMPGSFVVASALSMLLGRGGLQQLNPVTTAGSMQVKVDFALAQAGNEDISDNFIREQLYTRAGGIRYGTARLLGYEAAYDDIVFRFADYNAGPYASRNAAFQEMLGELTGQNLDLDGDVLAYEENGEPKDIETKTLQTMQSFGSTHNISAWTIGRDARKEKTKAFENTTTWQDVRAAWTAKKRQKAPYARLPDVKLSSPKLQQNRSTAWFANNVKRRYAHCRSKD